MSSMASRNVRLKTKRAAGEIEAPRTDTVADNVRAANSGELVIALTLAFMDGDKVLGTLPLRLTGERPPAGKGITAQLRLDAWQIYDGLSAAFPKETARGLAVVKPRVWKPGDPQ